MAGILIPKKPKILGFFPKLNEKVKNPRVRIPFVDHEKCIWYFAFVYYNGLLFGGTRNEFRLTGMTGYLNQHSVKSGDTLVFKRTSAGEYRVLIERKCSDVVAPTDDAGGAGGDVLILGSSLRTIRLKK